MPTALFSHKYYELIWTAADTRLVDRHSDHPTLRIARDMWFRVVQRVSDSHR